MFTRRAFKIEPRDRAEARTILAYHEAGHAVLGARLGEAPARVSIVGDGNTWGHTSQRMGGEPALLAQIYLAGFAAEHLLTGRRARQLDQELGFAILTLEDTALLLAFEGAKERDGHRAVHELLRSAQLRSGDEVRAEVARHYAAARAALAGVWPVVQRVATALLERHVLERQSLREALGSLSFGRG